MAAMPHDPDERYVLRLEFRAAFHSIKDQLDRIETGQTEKLDRIEKRAERIEDHVEKTNGRVTKVEEEIDEMNVWRAKFEGALAAVVKAGQSALELRRSLLITFVSAGLGASLGFFFHG